MGLWRIRLGVDDDEMRVEFWMEVVRGEGFRVVTAKFRGHVQNNPVDIYHSCFMLLLLFCFVLLCFNSKAYRDQMARTE